jgi:glycosyltransferase involved in cell wall biosynthesis
MNPAVSLIVSTYNWPAALELCLRSILFQTRIPDEIIIADDGSGEDTRHVIEKSRILHQIPVKHVWQEDKGFRASEIRNKAILQSEMEYIIFADGDVLLHREFVSDHLTFCKPDTFLTGSRVLINQEHTSRLFSGDPFRFGFFSRNFQNRLNGIRIRGLAHLISENDENYFNARSCNLSAWKSDLIEVNGFDHRFTGWGREDTDLFVRLINAGKSKFRLKMAAVQYHLYHPDRSRESIIRNDELLQRTISEKLKTATIGLSNLEK